MPYAFNITERIPALESHGLCDHNPWVEIIGLSGRDLNSFSCV